MRLLITRPKEDADPLANLLRKAGHQPVIFPLLSIVYEKGATTKLASYKLNDVQALLMTSANGVRSFAHADKRRAFKVMAVGEATAKVARQAGFKDVVVAGGDVEALAKTVKETLDPQAGLLLHGAGTKLAGDLKGLLEKEGFHYERLSLYHADKTQNLSASLINQFKEGMIDGVTLYSPRTADSFAALVEKAGLKEEMKKVTAFGLSEAVAQKLGGLMFENIVTAKTPDQDALLQAINQYKEEKMSVASSNENNKPQAMPKDEPAKDSKGIDTKATSPKEKAVKKEPSKTDKTSDPVEKTLNKAKEQSPAIKGSWKLKAGVAAVVLVVAVGAGAYFTQDMWVPKVKSQLAQALNLQAPQTPNGVSQEELAAVISRLNNLEKRPVATSSPAPAPDLEALTKRLESLEEGQGEIKIELSGIEMANGNEDKLAEFKNLAARIEAVEGAKPQDLSGLEEENKRLSQLVTELNNRLTDLEAARVQQRTFGETQQALIAALSGLRQTMNTSKPYAAELQALGVLAQGDVVLEEAVQTLLEHAEQGLASNSALRGSFETLANDIVRAAAIPQGAGWVEQTVKNITSLVTIRRAPGNLEGEGPLGIVARTEHNLKNGDLAAAVAELKHLDGKPLETAQDWIEAAQARLKGDKTLALMQAHILSLAGDAGGQG